MTKWITRNETKPRGALRKIILSNHQSPGDGVVLTAAIRDLHKQHPGKFVTDIRCPWPALFENSPYITRLDDRDPDVARIKCEYPLIHQADACGLHFLHGFIQDLAKKLAVPLHLTEQRGDVHLSAEERAMPPQVEGDYWLGNFGSKPDFTNKQYSVTRYQEVVTRLRGEVQFVQVGEAHHSHVPLDGVVDLIGKTSLRELIRLVHHSSGCLTGNSMLMHLAAAVPTRTGRSRPCVVIAGGREPVKWCQYKNHRFLHTIGQLDCCKEKSCWKSRVQKLHDGSKQDESLCLHPIEVQ